MVKIPASLAVAATPLSSVKSLQNITITSPTASYSETSGGYYMVKSAVTLMSDMAPVLVISGIEIDAIISQNSLKAGTYPTEKITLTEPMYNAIVALLPALTVDKSLIGTSETLTDVKYATNGTSLFQNSLTFTATDTTDSSTYTNTFEWSADRTKLRMSQTNSVSRSTFIMTYDSVTNSSAFKIDMIVCTYQLAIQKDASSLNNGVFVYESVTMTTTSDTSYSIYGYADDNGGLVQSTLAYTIGSVISNYYKEGFNANGILVYAAWSVTDINSLTIDPTFTDTTPVTTYGTKASTAGDKSSYGALNLISI
jgi:hypothetical protein